MTELSLTSCWDNRGMSITMNSCFYTNSEFHQLLLNWIE